MKCITGDWLLGLETQTIEHLLQISTEEADPAQFDPSKVVERWRLSGKHSCHPNSHPYGTRKKVRETAAESSILSNQVDMGASQQVDSGTDSEDIDSGMYTDNNSD